MTEQTQGKGRPTPKRSQRARGPVAPPPTNRREAARALRMKNAQQREAIRKGTKAGDEKAFLPRDRGPVRSYVRDVVDSERTLGPVLLPYMLVVLVTGFISQPLYAAAFLGMLGVIVIVGIDYVRLGRIISRGLKERFPDERRRPHVFYGIQRTALVRRWRTPPPKVGLGDPV